MKFKEFNDWCNNRACDGCWGMVEAMACIDIAREILKEPFWKREKIWKTKYEADVVSQIVEPTNKLIKKYLNN